MKCGAKCFVVEFEMDGKKQKKQVIARTPVEVRRTVRSEFGTEVEIISVKKS